MGIGGLFGYHLIYFTAIRITPAVEVSLIAYLWPLFLVVFSTFLPNEKLHRHHVVGVIMGLSGAGLIISKGNISGVFQNFSFGHLLAFICAVIWASYSVLSRRFRNAPVELVSGFCLATAALSLIAHLVFETTVWPQLPTQWLAVLGLGLLPVGLAFYTWDYGVKHGDIMVLGAASYAAPLLSTLVLVSVGHTIFTWIISAGCLLITAGAVIAAKDMISKKPI